MLRKLVETSPIDREILRSQFGDLLRNEDLITYPFVIRRLEIGEWRLEIR